MSAASPHKSRSAVHTHGLAIPLSFPLLSIAVRLEAEEEPLRRLFRIFSSISYTLMSSPSVATNEAGWASAHAMLVKPGAERKGQKGGQNVDRRAPQPTPTG